MTDQSLAELFAEGTAPERDAEFARRVSVRIAAARPSLPLPLVLAARAAAVLAAAAAIYGAAREVGPALAEITGSTPHFMGVPVPVVLGILFLGLALRARRYVPLRLA